LGPAGDRPADPDRLADGERGLADIAAAVSHDRVADQVPAPGGAVGRLDDDGLAAVHRFDHAPLVGEGADGAGAGPERELSLTPAQEEEPDDPAADETAARGGLAGGLRPPGLAAGAGSPRRPRP